MFKAFTDFRIAFLKENILVFFLRIKLKNMHRETGENYFLKCASCCIFPVSYKYHKKTPSILSFYCDETACLILGKKNAKQLRMKPRSKCEVHTD